ncbi:Glutathione peroxidase 1 [Seminavis robusta]|uniref:Glutathione peroxidase 1 n=1 Tax=Seminavis robusta TaxID=568900 RepID=A0A9N8H6U2_9STRA|nr:Glutathione peroxidase 1 [Seminavis robusta]|eukprot:Sro110_g054880.1 Glutathione peroxidase 1 (333) ;mRNA; r:51397-52581
MWAFRSLFLALSLSSALNLLPQVLSFSPDMVSVRAHGTARESVLKTSTSDDDMETPSRRSVVSSIGLVGASGLLSALVPPAMSLAAETESFAEIAARANKISKELDTAPSISEVRKTDKTMYDFTLPIEGADKSLADIVRQQFDESGNNAKVKAILVVNIKQDDPVARKDIPELISLVTKYGRNGEFVVVCCPTEQGYFEPDTSTLIRLKLASEYGYGINPASVVTDKVNLLGTGAHPFWRWLEGTSRTPAGLGRVQGNFEKFLLDGRSGLPLRRYPRKYMPLDIKDDIEAVIAGRPVPPAGANWAEEWRGAAAEAERDTYRFEKGLNVFDQ